MKEDVYPNFAALKLNESDYRITLIENDSKVAILAIHGGRIERGTSEIARAISEDGSLFNLYLFEGLKIRHNHDLHITSSHFDEPQCLNLVSKMDTIVTIHGMTGDDPQVLIGGLDDELRQRIGSSLQNAGVQVEYAKKHLGAYTTKNIANKGSTQKGVQLEISSGLRDSANLITFSQAVKRALLNLDYPII